MGIELDLSETFGKIKNSVVHNSGRDYVASRGEYLNALILAKYLGFHFIDAKKVIFFNEDLQYDIWKSAVQAIREADMMIIVGCSLKVSPAAEMVEELREEAPLVVIDPAEPPFPIKRTYSHLKLAASKGMKVMEETLLQKTIS